MSYQPIGSFVIVVDKENKILLGQRKNCFKPGYFGCPGGRLEPDESLEDCAKRELYEETGLTALSLKYLGVIRTRQDGGNFIHFGFACTDYEGLLELKEPDKCVGWTFYSQDDIPTQTLPAHTTGIQLLSGMQTNLIDILNE